MPKFKYKKLFCQIRDNYHVQRSVITAPISLTLSESLIMSIGTTRPIPPNRRSCLGCIWWKDMSNPERLR